jgi:hypothetical protein
VGVYDRCSPLLSSEISILAAMLSSFEEVSRVFEDKCMSIGINAIRHIAQRFASRAKIAQQLETTALTDSLGQHHVVVSTDGGRPRLRIYKRGPRTKKERRRYKARWTEPKLVIIYSVVEAIINGEEPDGLSLAKLTRTFPEDWREQRRFFWVEDNCA